MARSFYQIVQAATGIIGIAEPNSLVGSRDPTSRSMLNLMNRGGRILTRKRNTWGGTWTVLTKEFEFTTVAGQQEYALPDDFDSLIDGTLWDRTTYREGRGTLSPQQWQIVKSGLIQPSAISPRYRLRRSADGTRRALYLDPVPDAVETLVFEYTSDSWLRSADGTFRTRIGLDTDEPLFPDDIVELDLIWRWKHERGLSFAAELAEFETERNRAFADDAGTRPIVVGRRSFRPRFPTLPEAGWGV